MKIARSNKSNPRAMLLCTLDREDFSFLVAVPASTAFRIRLNCSISPLIEPMASVDINPPPFWRLPFLAFRWKGPGSLRGRSWLFASHNPKNSRFGLCCRRHNAPFGLDCAYPPIEVFNFIEGDYG